MALRIMYIDVLEKVSLIFGPLSSCYFEARTHRTQTNRKTDKQNTNYTTAVPSQTTTQELQADCALDSQ